MDMGSGESSYTGVMLYIDPNKLLGLDLVKQHGFVSSDQFHMEKIDKVLFWGVRSVELPEGRIWFVLDLDEVKSATCTTPTEKYLSWGCAGRFRKLRVCLEPPKGCVNGITHAVNEMLEKRPSDLKVVASLQLRTQFAKARALTSKRMRASMEEYNGSEDEVLPATP